MTNSIASAKCPALSSGNYGMSQNRFTDETKEYIFVKLTDSAFRAVEEYQRNRNSTCFGNGQCATIKFIGNSGVIDIPTPNNGEGRKFGFAIDDVEGSLECIQQQQNELDVLGSLSYRMRIQANDDIYDTTRTKMAIAEETEKSKCIREIKPNQTDIGRKVKKPASSFNQNNNNNSSSFVSKSINRNKLGSLNNSSPLHATTISGGGGNSKFSNITSSRSSPNTTGAGLNAINSNSTNSRYGSHNSTSSSGTSSGLYSQNNTSSLTSAASLSSALAFGVSNGYAFTGSPNESSTASKSKIANGNNHLSGTNANQRGNGNIGTKDQIIGKGTSNTTTGNSKLPDISRRKIRERLVHLLALKPFKKPELYDRLRNEGIKDRERSIVSTILKDIAVMSRDNTYNLRRQIWNDVNENWPYYTEQELQQLKRRKPQNLTPPVSSDAGSSTSGQSPTSTHTGSPPPLVGNGVNGNLKRTSLDNYDDNYSTGVQPKKQRISHFKKDTAGSSNYNAVRLNYGNVNQGAQIGKSTLFSPLSGSNTQTVDENSGNSDLNYGILDNADDFMSNIDHGNSYFSNTTSRVTNNNRKTNANAVNNVQVNKNADFTRDKRGSGSSSNFSNTSYNYNNETKSKVSKSSPLPYGNNFVPESKSKSDRNSNNITNAFPRQSPAFQQQQQQPQQQHHPQQQQQQHYQQQQQQQQQQHQQQHNNKQQHHKLSNHHSPKMHIPTNPLEESNISTNRGNILKHQQTTKSNSRSKRPPTPPLSLQRIYQQPENMLSCSNTQQEFSQEHTFQTRQNTQQHCSPTQEIAKAVSSYTSMPSDDNLETPSYNFDHYQAITSIEERRRYKTDFERDFKEYRSLLDRITAVNLRFRGLADQLDNTPQDCADYGRIKEQIIAEYSRIVNEVTVQEEKRRFNYLHAKLAYIKQLVSDYDKTLTNGNVNGTMDNNNISADHHTNSSQQSNSNANTDNIIFMSRNTRLSPMVGSSESNSPPLSHQYHSQFQQQSTRYEHHDVETIHNDQLNNIRLASQSSPSQTIYNTHNDSDSSDDSSDSNDNDDEDDDESNYEDDDH
ncbi:RNA polymerase II elongation factor Ell [Teleopsis dalmanni]|uniref:RNA polymerase II elongation factor Ell n=1 Tax=Teleopsis dalmanni TaxID=139649 RepID=UPI0018CED5E8|nr:RNA polymerase II elongation factor Ell [Teleopsis dalmanni]